MCKHFHYLLLLFICLWSANCELVNTKVVRRIDIQSHLIKIDAMISVQNWGLNYVNKYTYILDPGVDHFYVKFKNAQNKELLFDKGTIKCHGNQTRCVTFRVHLNRHIVPNKACIIKAELVYIDKVVAVYKTRKFDEDHMRSYTGNLLFYSPYKTLLLQTTFVWKDMERMQVSRFPHYHGESSLNYSHTAIAPFRFEELQMDYVNNDPMLVVTTLERTIDVSHFGKIYVEERVAIINNGSKLVGPYENRQSDMVLKASDWWYMHLPASVDKVQFYDTIGSSSKSTLLHFDNHTTFKFRPRYPLLSGWKTFYIVRYSVPVFEYLYRDSHGRYLLRMRAVDHVVNDALIRNCTTRVLLPEGGRVVGVNVPRGFKRLGNENAFTGLCTLGRPTVVLYGSNIVENHIADVAIEYLFPVRYLLRVPLLLTLYLESVFMLVIVVVHIKS